MDNQKMPCRISDERVFNPWDHDEVTDEGRPDRIKALIKSYKTDPEMILQFLEATTEAALHLASLFVAFDEDESGEGWDRSRRVTIDYISAAMDEYFYGVAADQDEKDNPVLTADDYAANQSRD
jgi:hypothetical protein